MRKNQLSFERLSSILLLSCILIMLAACDTIELNSNWRDREITIDGTSSDWLNALTYIEKADISVGLLNDENFIYICVLAESPLIRAQIMRQGFILWFDPAGGKEKTFGIRFPLGMQGNFLPRRRSEDEQPPEMIGDEQDLENLQDVFKKSMTELEILGPGKNDRKRIQVTEAKGIDINVAPSSGMLVYEIKVPLIQSPECPYAVGAQPGKKVGIGFESPKLDIERMRRRMGGGIPGIGGRPGMGGVPGIGRGPGGGMRPELPTDLKFWLTAQLATNNNSVASISGDTILNYLWIKLRLL